jgi:hypothetical protein
MIMGKLQNGRQQSQLQLPLRLPRATWSWRPNQMTKNDKEEDHDAQIPVCHLLTHSVYCNSFLICCWFRICDLMCMLLSISNCSILTVLIVVFKDLRYGDWWLGGIIGAHKLQAPKDCKPWEEDMTLCFHLIPGPGPEIFCKLGFYSLAFLRSQN